MSKVTAFIEGMDYEDFIKDAKTIFAVVRALEVIGEASKSIPPSVKNRYTDIPWKDIAGMRDKLIHEYFGVNLKVVWNTVKRDIPQLRPQFERIRAEVKDDD